MLESILEIGKVIIAIPVLFPDISPPRESVEPLVLGVHGACHKSFPTYDMAKEFYLGAKKMGKVRIVRDPGDDERLGSI